MTPTQSEARTRVYRLLARAFRPPDAALVGDLLREDLPELVASLERLGARPELVAAASRLAEGLREVDPEHLARDYESSFEPSGGAERPPNETAHAPETPQEGLTRTFELADIAGFYRAFGVEVEPGGERVDHIAAELEFMHLLAVKQAVAEERGEVERAEICRDAAVAFLRDHLGRWHTKLNEHLERSGRGPVYPLAGEMLAGFIELEMTRPTCPERPNPAV